MEDTGHYETLLTSESLAGVRTFIHGGGVQLSCARRSHMEKEGQTTKVLFSSLTHRFCSINYGYSRTPQFLLPDRGHTVTICRPVSLIVSD